MSMRFIVSPAKKMTVTDELPWRDMPRFLDKSRMLASALRSMSFGELVALWKCSEKLARETSERMWMLSEDSTWDTPRFAQLTPAVLAYEGIQYQNMAPRVMTQGALEYVQEHLRVLSGFYGMLAPFDAVVPYRLEMGAKLQVAGARDLYAFWGDDLYRALAREADVVVNLASVEYARAVTPYFAEGKTSGQTGGARPSPDPSADLPQQVADLPRSPRLVTCLFGEVNEAGKFIQRSTHAKAARGTFVRWCASREVVCVDDLARFDVGHAFDEARSTDDVLVFVKA